MTRRSGPSALAYLFYQLKPGPELSPVLCRSRAAGCNLGQGAYQYVGIVQALSPPEFQAKFARFFSERDVDVIEDLDVVTQKPDRLNDDTCVALFFDGFQCIFHGWADPWAATYTLTLEGEVPIFISQSDNGHSLSHE